MNEYWSLFLVRVSFATEWAGVLYSNGFLFCAWCCVVHDSAARVLSSLFPICSNEYNGPLMQIHMLAHNMTFSKTLSGLVIIYESNVLFWCRPGRWQRRSSHPWSTGLWGTRKEKVAGAAHRLHSTGQNKMAGSNQKLVTIALRELHSYTCIMSIRPSVRLSVRPSVHMMYVCT